MNELARLEALKQASLAQLIQEARQTIQAKWEELRMGEEERREFTPFFVNVFTDDVLDLHEAEIEKLEEKLKITRPIIQVRESLSFFPSSQFVNIFLHSPTDD